MREYGQNVRAGNRPKWVTELIGVLADILIAAVILLVFAYIHHGRAYLFGKLEADPPCRSRAWRMRLYAMSSRYG